MNTFSPTSRRDFDPSLGIHQRYRHDFGDERLSKRFKSMYSKMEQHQSVVIHSLGEDKTDTTAMYRFINNEKVKPEELIYLLTNHDPRSFENKDILVLEDTCSIPCVRKKKNAAKHRTQTGVLNNNKTPGFHIHSSLLVDRQTNSILGLGDIAVFSRPQNTLTDAEKKEARTQQHLVPFEDKESSVWSLSYENTAKQLQGCSRLTSVMDQGADCYEVMLKIASEDHQHFIVRSKENRKLRLNATSKSTVSLNQFIDSQPYTSEKTFDIRSLDHISKSNGKRVKRKGREARIRIRYRQIELNPPSHLEQEGLVLRRKVYAVEVKEHESTVPQGEQAIHWILLTTWDVSEDAQAWEVVEAYRTRWDVEQQFRVLKKQGLGIENTQIQSFEAIKKQAIIAMDIAVKAMQLVKVRDGKTHIPIETMFDESEQTLLSKVNKKYEGKTEKQQNPHQTDSLAWAAWVIARMGGWKGYISQRPPGPITMKSGLERFYQFVWASKILEKP